MTNPGGMLSRRDIEWTLTSALKQFAQFCSSSQLPVVAVQKDIRKITINNR